MEVAQAEIMPFNPRLDVCTWQILLQKYFGGVRAK